MRFRKSEDADQPWWDGQYVPGIPRDFIFPRQKFARIDIDGQFKLITPISDKFVCTTNKRPRYSAVTRDDVEVHA